jgi:hypothetical protein
MIAKCSSSKQRRLVIPGNAWQSGSPTPVAIHKAPSLAPLPFWVLGIVCGKLTLWTDLKV